FDARLRDRMTSLTRRIGEHGARVLWATYPHVRVRPELDGTGSPPFPENDPVRVDRWNELMKQAISGIPNTGIVDFATYARDQPGGEFDPQFRLDGVHLSVTSTKAAARWFGPQLVTPR